MKILAGYEAKIQVFEHVPEETKKQRGEYKRTLKTIEIVDKDKIKIGKELELMEKEERMIYMAVPVNVFRKINDTMELGVITIGIPSGG